MSTATIDAPNGAVTLPGDDWTTEVPEPGGSFHLAPAGNLGAACIGIYALGTHSDTYQGETKSQVKLALLFETPGEIDPDGNPFTFAIEFTHSLNEKAKLRHFLEGWRGKKFETLEKFSLAAIVGKSCLLNVTHSKGKKDKVYANAGAATPLPKGMTVGQPFHVEPDGSFLNYSPKQLAAGVEPPDYEWLPRTFGEKLADKAKESAEWKALHGGAAGGAAKAGEPTTAVGQAEADGDIPF